MINPPIKFALLTVSDRAFAGIRQDLSGPALMDEILSFGGEISAVQIVADDKNAIMRILSQWCDVSLIDIILTTGGTGFSHRDITPEATLSILDKQTPGLVHAIYSASLNITPYAMLSRPAAGIRGKTLIVNLPGNPKAAVENFNIIKPALTHAVEILRNDPDVQSLH